MNFQQELTATEQELQRQREDNKRYVRPIFVWATMKSGSARTVQLLIVCTVSNAF